MTEAEQLHGAAEKYRQMIETHQAAVDYYRDRAAMVVGRCLHVTGHDYVDGKCRWCLTAKSEHLDGEWLTPHLLYHLVKSHGVAVVGRDYSELSPAAMHARMDGAHRRAHELADREAEKKPAFPS